MAALAGTARRHAGSARALLSQRAIRVHVPSQLRARVRSFDLIVAGRTVARGVRPTRGALIDLRGRHRDSVFVVLRLRLRDGRTIDDARR